MAEKHKALFLDRDGVINEDSHYPFLPEHITFRQGIFDLCSYAQKCGYAIIVVSNQAGVARGKFTEQDVQSLHAWMTSEFAHRGICIEAFYYCPYHQEASIPLYRKDSEFRKPRPGMFLQAAKEHDIDLSRSIMIGDKESDRIEHPQLACIILKSEYAPNNYDIEDLSDARTFLE